jgi:23S rRNA (adenine2503-C2)-methyltransferase
MQPDVPRSFHDFTRDELTALVESWSFSPVHAARMWSYVYNGSVTRFADMIEVPARLRTRLEQEISLALPTIASELHSADGFTRKFLLALGDGRRIETVLMRFTGRVTACVSSQAGCAMGCGFCATGRMGFMRHLTPGEIVAQVMHVRRALEPPVARGADPGLPSQASTNEGPASTRPATISPSRLRNVVLMGMGEPLHNYDNLLRALTILNAEWGLGFGARRITLSTSGLVPKILQLAEERVGFRLAVSLHGATNEVREQIMPVNKRWPLEELIPAIRVFAEKHGRMVTLEFILIEGVNDTLEQAAKLREIAADLHAHVNLIPYNAVEGLSWKRPDLARQQKFVEILQERGVSVTLRREKGHDIDAACGQLRLKTEKDRETQPSPT